LNGDKDPSRRSVPTDFSHAVPNIGSRRRSRSPVCLIS
jgi:hypothetical protein